jgi:hypothetical protein
MSFDWSCGRAPGISAAHFLFGADFFALTLALRIFIWQ